MLKKLRSVLAIVLVLAIAIPMFSAFAVSATENDLEPQTEDVRKPFVYVKGGNDVSESYKNSEFYEKLSKLHITGDQRTDVVAVALTQAGYLESDIEGDYAGTYVGGWKDFTEYNYNMGDWGAGYGYDESIGAAMHWCASFVSWALLQSQVYELQKGSISDWCRKNTDSPEAYMWREVGVGHWVDQVTRAGYYKKSHAKGGDYIPLSGDIIFFTNDGTSRSHIGLVVYSDEENVYTVEGNTSASGYSSNSACCAVKSYTHDSTYILGYGAMPYTTVEGAAKVDFSGKTRTTGYYMNTNDVQNIYADEDCNGTVIGQIERNTMFDVIEVCDNGMLKVISEVYGGSYRMGYIDPDYTRTIQLTNEVQDSKRMLELLAESATGIYYKEYTEATLEQIRSAYASAKALLADESATEADYASAYESLSALLNNKGVNDVAAGARVDCIDVRISGGISTILTSDFNDGNINSTNGNFIYAAVIKAKLDTATDEYKVTEIVSFGNGVPSETTVADDEILIAAHDWETGVTDGPVYGSADNFKTVRNAQIGQTVKLYGIDLATKTLAPGAYISIVGEGNGETVDPDVENLALRKSYTGEGYKIVDGQWPASYNANLTDGTFLNALSLDADDWFGFCRSEGSNGINTSGGVGSVVIDLGDIKGIKGIKVNTFVGSDSGISAPVRITAYVAEKADGTFVKMGDLTMGQAYNDVAWASLDKTANGRYVKVEVQLKDAFVFIDEIMVLGGATLENPEITYPSDEKPPVEKPEIMKGDVNGSGKIDSMDYVLLKRAYFGTYELKTLDVGDINDNGKIDSMDYVYLRRSYFGTYTIK